MEKKVRDSEKSADVGWQRDGGIMGKCEHVSNGRPDMTLYRAVRDQSGTLGGSK